LTMVYLIFHKLFLLLVEEHFYEVYFILLFKKILKMFYKS